MKWKDKFPQEGRYFETRNGILYNGDVLEVLKKFPDESVDCVITSPPYWGLRDYGVDGQLGLEPTFEEYLEKLWEVFDEVYRILKPMGTLWVNLGDTYFSKTKGGGGKAGIQETNKGSYFNVVKLKNIYKEKSLCLIPERFAIGMIERGWILRNQIIWQKPNAMPESVKDRFTVDYEKIFFFVKQKKYYFEQQFEPNKTEIKLNVKWNGNRQRNYVSGNSISEKNTLGVARNPKGRNKRTVWFIPTKPFRDAHFAVFPPEIPEICIKAGCPLYVCSVCGRPREKILQRIPKYGKVRDIGGKYIHANSLVHSVGARKTYYTMLRKYKIPKSMQVAFAKWLRKYVSGKELQLDREFGREKWQHWIRTDNSGQSLPSPDDYRRLKEVLNLPDEWDKWLLETVETIVDDSGNSYVEYGWSEHCSCGNRSWEKGIVLDIFMGSGTTAVVAEGLNRHWIGIELNPEYCKIIKERVKKAKRFLF